MTKRWRHLKLCWGLPNAGSMNISWINRSISSSSQLCTPQLWRKQTWIQILTIPLANSGTFASLSTLLSFLTSEMGLSRELHGIGHMSCWYRALQEYQPHSAGALPVSSLAWRCSQFRVEATAPQESFLVKSWAPSLSEQQRGGFCGQGSMDGPLGLCFILWRTTGLNSE